MARLSAFRIVNLHFALIAGCFVALVAGCGGKAAGPAPVDVKGTVTLDKKPLAKGKIMFSDPGFPPDEMEITNGTFSGKAKPGEKRLVQIYSYKEGPLPKPMEGVTFEPTQINIIPKQYNTETILNADVKEDAENVFKFEVTSK